MGGSRKSAPGGQGRVRGGQGGQVDTSAVGASRGAEGAEGVGLGEGVSPSPRRGVPLPNGEGSGEGAVPPPEKIFDFKLAYFYGF